VLPVPAYIDLFYVFAVLYHSARAMYHRSTLLPRPMKERAGFDSRTHEKVSKSSAELQLVNLIFHIFNGENNYALAA
jgi:hypothetical protein